MTNNSGWVQCRPLQRTLGKEATRKTILELVRPNVTNDRDRSAIVPDRRAVTGGFSPSVDFISSIIAGLVLGIGLDWWLGTRPIFIIVFIIAGFVNGFFKMWRHSAVLETQAEERRREF